MTEYFNEYFVSIGKSLAEKCNRDNCEYLQLCELPKAPNVLNNWEKVNEVEVEVLIEKMGISKNSNIDDISAFLLKECLLCSLTEVTHLFNCVFNSGIFPDHWKLVTVVPLFKGGELAIIGRFHYYQL